MGAEVWNPVLELGPVALPGVGHEFAGKILYLGTTDSTASVLASDDQPGTTRDRPKSTLAGALAGGGGLAEAPIGNRGDVIYCLPSYAESIAASTTLSLAGLALVGLSGRGGRKPTLTFTTATASKLNITGAGTVIENLKLVGNINNQASMITVAAADCVIRNCDMTLATGTNYCLIGILTTAAADRLLVENCRILGLTFTAGTAVHTNGVQIVGGSHIRLVGNTIAGRFSATLGCVQVVTTASTNLRLEGNTLENWTTASSKVFVDTITGTTGTIGPAKAPNHYLILANATTPVTAATMVWGLNYLNNNGGVGVAAVAN